jgi:hypothetical protein
VSELVNRRVDNVNKLGILLGFIVLMVALAAAPMPLMVELQNPVRNVVIYPNLLFAVPLILLEWSYCSTGPQLEIGKNKAASCKA